MVSLTWLLSVPCRPLLIKLVVWSQTFYSFHIQMPLNPDTPTDSLKVEKICTVSQRKYLFPHHLSIDLTTIRLMCVRVIWWQLVICSFLGKLPWEKASVGLRPVVLHSSNIADRRNLLPRLTPMSILVNCGAECTVCIVQLTDN